MMCLKYLGYVIRHKWFVMLECFKMGLFWQGIVHDLSKLLPSEFFPYANHFYGKGKAGIKEGRDKTGYYKPHDTGDPAFDYAWFLHQKRNKHHWQYWILPTDGGGTKAIEMPNKYMEEMICDWRGASRAQGHGGKVREWFKENYDKLVFEEKTREAIKAHLYLGIKF